MGAHREVPEAPDAVRASIRALIERRKKKSLEPDEIQADAWSEDLLDGRRDALQRKCERAANR